MLKSHEFSTVVFPKGFKEENKPANKPHSGGELCPLHVPWLGVGFLLEVAVFGSGRSSSHALFTQLRCDSTDIANLFLCVFIYIYSVHIFTHSQYPQLAEIPTSLQDVQRIYAWSIWH